MMPRGYMDCYDKIASQHVAHIAERGQSSPFVPDDVYLATHEETSALLAHLVRDNTKILDVGIGPGFLMDALEKVRKVAIYGIDVAQPYLDRLWANKRNWCVCWGDADVLPFPPSSFDYVCLCDVLEHVPDVHQALREAVRVLHPGGHGIVRVPNDEDLSGYLESTEYPFCHVRKFDLYSLSMLLTKCHGQELLACGPGQCAPSELYAVFRKPL